LVVSAWLNVSCTITTYLKIIIHMSLVSPIIRIMDHPTSAFCRGFVCGFVFGLSVFSRFLHIMDTITVPVSITIQFFVVSAGLNV
jgi:hypothetical protein